MGVRDFCMGWTIRLLPSGVEQTGPLCANYFLKFCFGNVKKARICKILAFFFIIFLKPGKFYTGIKGRIFFSDIGVVKRLGNIAE